MLLPMNFPVEIIEIIHSHLGPKDIYNCVFVCKSWYTIFNDLLWKTCTLREFKPSPTVESLEKNQSLIKSLVIEGLAPIVTDTYCMDPYYTALHSLEFQLEYIGPGSFGFDSHTSENLKKAWKGLTAIIHASSGLKALKVSTNRIFVPNHLWKAIARRNVNKLVLNNVRISGAESSGFWKTCVNIEVLDIQRCSFFDLSAITNSSLPKSFPRMKSIRFNYVRMPPADQWNVISRCPKLCSVFFRARRSRELTKEIISRLEQPNFPELEMLDVPLKHSSSDDIEIILKKVPSFRKNFEIPGSLITKSELDQHLFDHISTLESMDLSGCKNIGSKEILLILRTYPFLKSFKGGTIQAPDLKDGNDVWACADRLEILHICIVTTEPRYPPRRQSNVVFSCLSKLVSLQEFALRPNESSIEPQQDTRLLRFDLDLGLDKLITLKQMRRLIILMRSSGLDRTSKNWMLENWKKIEYIKS